MAAFQAHQAKAQTLFFDTNGTATNFGSPGNANGVTAWGTWNAASTEWSTSSTGNVATQAWLAGDIAEFVSADTTGTGSGAAATLNEVGARVTLADVESVGGLFFKAADTTIGGTGSTYGLSIGASAGTTNFTITNAVNNKQIIAVPIIGSGDMTVAGQTGAGPTDIAGDLTQFTGNLYVLNKTATPSTSSMPEIQLDDPLGDSTKTIFLDQWIQLENNNEINDNGHNTPNSFTLANNIILNYLGVANNTTDTIGSSAGPAGIEKIENYSGNISSAGGPSIITNLLISGTNGTTVVSGNNTYTGSTTVNNSATTGMFQIGNNNALPSTTTVIFASGGPMDLNGHNVTISGLSTTTANNTATTDGNIYNTFQNSAGATAASITITPATTTNLTFKGDIGVTQNTTGYFTNAPEAGNVGVSTNISLTLNGPTGGGTNTLTLAPTANEASGNEYTGTTTVNSGAVLVLGRVTAASPGTGYTVTGNGNVTINNGGILASSATGTTSYAGGFGGNIEMKSGSALNVGGAGTTGILSSTSMTVDSGANLNFDFGPNSAVFDQLNLNGGLTIDQSGNSILNLGLATGTSFIAPSTYSLIKASGGVSTSGSGTGSLLFANGTTTETLGADLLSLSYSTANTVQVVVSANVVQWDPTGTGVSNLSSGTTVTESAGVWTDGASKFVDYNTVGGPTEITWSNAAARDVIIGNDPNQGGANENPDNTSSITGSITLGSNITVGKLTFGAIFPGFDYQIADNGSGNVLTINGGVSVNNNAATSADPSAEIDVPITLGANQTWEVDPGQFLDIKGTVTGTGLTMSKTGSGVVDFEGHGGSIGTLDAQAGIALLGAVDGLGNATLSLDGGAVEYGSTGTANNPIIVTANGGSLGTTTGTATITTDFTASAGTFTAIGTGTTIFTGNVNVTTFTDNAGSTGVMAFGGPTNIGTFTSKSGIAALAGTSAISVGTLISTGGTTVLDNDNTTIGTYTLSGGTIQIGNNDAHGSFYNGTMTIMGTGTGAALGTIALDRSDNWTFVNPLAGGSLSIQQNGGGTVTMDEVNTTTFGTSGTGINNGTIALGENNALGQGTVNLAGPSSGIAALNLSGFSQLFQGVRSSGSFASNELITNDSATVSTLTIVNTGAAEYDGNITGNINLQHGDGVHTGIGNETLGGNVSVNSPITLYAGTLTIGNAATSGTINSLPVVSVGTLAAIGFSRSDTVSISNVLSSNTGDNLVVVQSGPGTTIISNANTYTGGASVTNGTLQLGVNSALSLGTLGIGSGTNTAGTGTTLVNVVSTFDLNGFNQRVLKLSDGGTGNFGNEIVTNSSATASTLSFASGGGTFGGIISGNLDILHDGSGSQGFGGSNTFTGSLSVSAGTISTTVWNAPNVPGPLGEPGDGIGTITLGGAGGTTGILDYEGTTAFTLPRPIVMATGGIGGLRIINATGQLTVPAGSISGGGGFEKVGNGTIIMQGAQTYAGLVMDVNGNLNIDTVADIGQPSGLGTGANTATIQLGDGSGNVGTISFNSPTPQETNRPFTEVENGTGGHVIMAGDLSAPNSSASSNLTLTGGIDLTNSVSITGGTVIFGGAGMITVATNPIAGPLGNVVLGINNATSPTTNGTGTLVLSANNTYGGGTYIRNGWLVVSSDTNLGAATAPLNFNGVGAENGTLLLNGAVNGTRPINVIDTSTGTAAIDDAGFNSTFGAVAGTAPLSKYGSGNLGVASVRMTSALNINAGTVSNVSSRAMSATSEVTALNIAGTMGGWTATANLGANDMIVDYTGSSPLATIQDQIHSGFNGGHWTGTGINSSAAAAAFGSGHPTAIGYAEASSLLGPSGGTFDGLSVDGTAVLLSYTYSGDANLDGKVNALDFNTLASNFGVNNGSQVWSHGDYNYDGNVDSNDFALLAANYNSVLPTSAALPSALPFDLQADAMTAQSLGSVVPEPASLSLVALLGAGLVRRRRNA